MLIAMLAMQVFYFKRKHFNVSYAKSVFYDESNFPMQIVYKTNGYHVLQATTYIKNAVDHYNDIFDYHLLTFNSNVNYQQHIITLQNSEYAHGCPSSFDGYSNVLAHATMPPNRLICIDMSENWNNRPDSEKLYKRVLLHEIGHVLGLFHTTYYNSIMSYNDIDGLQEYDVYCLKQLYPFLDK